MKKVIAIVLGIIGMILSVGGIISKVKGNKSISIIGGADGPTSIFIAGKVGSDFAICLLVIGVILLVVAGVLAAKIKREE